MCPSKVITLSRSITVPLVPETVPTKLNEGNHCKLKLHKREAHVKTSENCVSKDKVNITSCSGNCVSSAIATPGGEPYDADCSCCKPKVYLKTNITVVCPGNIEKEANHYIISECECSKFSCSANPSHDNEVAVDANSGVPIDNSDKKKRRRRALSRLFALPP